MTEHASNESTDLANLRLKLRAGLDFELQEHGGAPCYVIFDETSSNYFQIGVPEYAFLSVLDGNTTLQQAIQETSTRLGDDALTIRDAVRIGHWLLESGLANAVDDSGSMLSNITRVLEKNSAQARQKITSQLNPLFMRLPLGSPQAFIQPLAAMFGWVCSIGFFAIWAAIVVFAMVRVFQQPQDLAASAQGLFSATGWIWMVATLIGLKAVHEIGHGLFCHHFGGSVKETGIVFILFIPMPYVDVTSCWSFDSKWKRIAVSGAGMYVEIFLAAVAAIVWSFSHDPIIKFHLFNVMLLGSLTTVLFNANFLMRFDGYYILSDLVEIPNLYQKGQQFVNGLGRRFVWGMKAAGDSETIPRSVIIRAYGIAAFVWRVFICVTLTILATALLYGFGLALAMVGVTMWLGTPAWRFLSQCRDPANGSRPNFKWISTVTIPTVSLAALAMFLLPWPVQVSAPALVEYATPSIVRADAAGFVKAVHVESGQSVADGELLVELENRELELRLRESELERERSIVRSRSLHQNREIAAYQAENASRRAIEEQITELQQQLSSLRLVATSAGVVIGDSLETLPGQRVASGGELMRVVDENRKTIAVSVSQDHFDAFASNRMANVQFVPRHGVIRTAGILNSVQPTATSTADVRLTSYAGGSLAVRPRTPGQNSARAENENQNLELVASRFDGEVQIDSLCGRQLRAGTVGTIRLSEYDRTIAESLTLSTRRWLLQLWHAVEE